MIRYNTLGNTQDEIADRGKKGMHAMAQKLVKLYKANREMIFYLFFGGATTVVNWGFYGLMVRLLGCSITVSNAAAWVVAVIFAFFTNKAWVFQSRSWRPQQVLREAVPFLGARVFSGLLEIALVPLLFQLGLTQSLFNIEGFAAKVLVSVFVIALNYVFSKLFVFRRGE